MDDFGTGYSSLAYLKRFPLQHAQDRPVVRARHRDRRRRRGDRRHRHLAGPSLNLKVVAEGVETEEQLAFLLEIGCDAGQGHYLSLPLGAGELTSLLGKAGPGASRESPTVAPMRAQLRSLGPNRS